MIHYWSFIYSGTTKSTRGSAFVVYHDIYDAKKAVDSLSGFKVSGRFLVINYYKASKYVYSLEFECDRLGYTRRQISRSMQRKSKNSKLNMAWQSNCLSLCMILFVLVNNHIIKVFTWVFYFICSIYNDLTCYDWESNTTIRLYCTIKFTKLWIIDVSCISKMNKRRIRDWYKIN